jgi:hypothetical protein
MGGPRHSRERIEIPANLVGDVGKFTRDSNFEERRLDTSTKGKAMSETLLQQAKSELNRGFDCKLSVDGFDVQHRLSLPAGSYSGAAGSQASLRDILAATSTDSGPANKPTAMHEAVGGGAPAHSPGKEKPDSDAGVFV